MIQPNRMVVFGARDVPTKTIIIGRDKRLNKYAAVICESEDGEIVGYYTELVFCKKESLDEFIDILQQLKGMVTAEKSMQEL